MRLSSENGEVAILDTIPECKVILDALKDPDMPNPDLDPTSDDLENTIDVRFRRQALYESSPLIITAFAELVNQPSPEFRIELRDVDFVRQAAQRILNQREFSETIFNERTKRTQAANTIIEALETTTL